MYTGVLPSPPHPPTHPPTHLSQARSGPPSCQLHIHLLPSALRAGGVRLAASSRLLNKPLCTPLLKPLSSVGPAPRPPARPVVAPHLPCRRAGGGLVWHPLTPPAPPTHHLHHHHRHHHLHHVPAPQACAHGILCHNHVFLWDARSTLHTSTHNIH